MAVNYHDDSGEIFNKIKLQVYNLFFFILFYQHLLSMKIVELCAFRYLGMYSLSSLSICIVTK